MPDSLVKIVIKNRGLLASDSGSLQLVATVFIPGQNEYRVYAPEEAHGDAVEWVRFFDVRQPAHSQSGETKVEATQRIYVSRLVEQELQRLSRDENRPVGMNPDGVHYDAYICEQGHILSAGRTLSGLSKYCSRCGSAVISECPACDMPIRGMHHNTTFASYQRPDFCHNCGQPLPWMKEMLDTASELLNHDDKLSLEDREACWKSLKYVMSDPKADLVPEKKKLIGIYLEKATAATREFVIDVLARTGAEIVKGQ